MNLQDKAIFITGATSGIGLELVTILANQAKKVIVTGRNQDKLDNLCLNFPNIISYKLDLLDLEEMKKVIKEIQNNYIVDIIINNAAIQIPPLFIEKNHQIDNISTEINTNFTSICWLTSLFLPHLISTESNKFIVNINSGLAFAPKKQSAVYCATKAALFSFTKSLRLQLADSNIRVLQVFLPLTNTPMTKGRATTKNSKSPKDVALEIMEGIKKEKQDIFIGKTKLIPFFNGVHPRIVDKIMSKL